MKLEKVNLSLGGRAAGPENACSVPGYEPVRLRYTGIVEAGSAQGYLVSRRQTSGRVACGRLGCSLDGV